MKKNELKELRGKAVELLEKELTEKRSRLNDLRFDLSLGKIKNVREIRQLKKSIAQILTLIRERTKK